MKMKLILIIMEATKPVMKSAAYGVIAAMLLLAAAQPAQAANYAARIQFRHGHFEPQRLTVPARQPLTLRVVNQSRRAIEFESFKLNRERVVAPGRTITLYLPALEPGRYDFYDDFHQEVPAGEIVAQ
jgi:hypothetical protein